MDQVSTNQPNQNTFPPNSPVSDKHLDFIQQTQKTNTYINPNNFQEVLGNTQSQPTQSTSSVQQFAQNPAPTTTPNPQQTPVIEKLPLDAHYHELKKQAQTTITPRNTYEILKLAIYMIPLLGLFVLLLKSPDDHDVQWHTRQSVVAQGIWFGVILFLTILDAPIFSSTLLSIWRIVGYLVLIYAGAKAYLGEQFAIPVIYDIGKNFIDGKN